MIWVQLTLLVVLSIMMGYLLVLLLHMRKVHDRVKADAEHIHAVAVKFDELFAESETLSEAITADGKELQDLYRERIAELKKPLVLPHLGYPSSKAPEGTWPVKEDKT